MNQTQKTYIYLGGLIVAFALGGGSALTVSWILEQEESDGRNRVLENTPQTDLNDQSTLPSVPNSNQNKVVEIPISTSDIDASSRSKMLEHVAMTDDGDVSLQLIQQFFDSSDRDIASIEALIPIITLKVVSAVGHEAALEQVQLLDPRLRSRPIEFIFRSWAVDAPFEALASLEHSDYDDIDMKTIVIESWANHDSEDLLANISTLPTMLRTSAEAMAVYSIAGTSPDRAIEHVSRFSGTPFERIFIEHLVDTWARSDPEAALNWTLESEVHPVIKDNALTKILRTIANFDPEDAFERARKLDADPVFAGLALSVINRVAITDPDLAKVMANEVNELAGWISVGRGFVEKNDWNQVLTLADSVASSDKQDYWEHVIEYWALKDPESLYERLDNLPQQPASTAALQIAIHNRWYRFLDADAFAHTLTFLLDQDESIFDKVYYEPNNRYISVSDGHGFSKTYTMDDVLAIIYRDARKGASVLPVYSD